MKTRGFSLLDLIFLMTFTGIVVWLAIPPFFFSRFKPNQITGAANTGKKIHTAIMFASLERPEQMVWPTTRLNPDGPLTNAYTNATDYFWDAIDGKNIANPAERHPTAELETNWLSYGVDLYNGSGRLLAENVAWCIAANVHPELPDAIPVLITRNLDPRELVLKYDGSSTTKFTLGKDERSSKPFGDQVFVVVRFGGAAESFKAKAATLEDLFFGQVFDITELKVGGEKLKYLTPWETVSPREQ